MIVNPFFAVKKCRANLLVIATLTIGLVFSFAVVATVNAAQLIMVEEQGCVYCKHFNIEIAGAYPKTDEGERAPLRRVDIDQPWPDDLGLVKPATLTPTFILVEDGREIDRLIGYPGDEHFWFLLGNMLDKLPVDDANKALGN